MEEQAFIVYDRKTGEFAGTCGERKICEDYIERVEMDPIGGMFRRGTLAMAPGPYKEVVVESDTGVINDCISEAMKKKPITRDSTKDDFRSIYDILGA